MKTNTLKSVLVIIVFCSFALTLFGCNTSKFYVIKTGYSLRSISVVNYEDTQNINRFTEQFSEADSVFNEKYKLKNN